VIDHFVIFCSSSYTTIRNTNPDSNPNRKPNPNLNPNHNPTLITDTIQYNKMS